MNSDGMKIVDFHKYCETCKHKDCKDTEGEEPCNECLTYPENLYSKKPLKYEEA